MRRIRLLAVGAITSIFAAFGVVAPAEAAVDYFLDIQGIPGESQDAKLAKTIEIHEFSWDAFNDKKGARFSDLVVRKQLDLASTELFKRLATGTTIPSAEILGRSAGENPTVFVRYCMQNVQVTSIQQNSGDEAPQETVSFSFAALSEQYSTQDSKGGITQTVFAGWNVTSGQLIDPYPVPCGTGV